MSLHRTVPDALWDEMAGSVSPEFADSYLSGATVRGSDLWPHTMTAFLALKRSTHASAAVQRAKLKLHEPLPFGHPERNGQ